MNIKVKTNNVEITSALKEYAQKKMEKLDKFSSDVQSVSVELHIEPVADASQRQMCHVTTYVSGSIIRTEEASHDMYASIDLVFDKLGRQLKRHKEKMKDHHNTSASRLIAEELSKSIAASDNDSEAGKYFTPDELFIPKPLEVEEAVRLMRERELPFLAFRNFKHEKINVVYPMGEEFGLIDPHKTHK